MRRVCLAFEKLSFYHVTKLYNRFCVKFREALNESQQTQGIRDSLSFGDKSMRLIEMVEDEEEGDDKKALLVMLSIVFQEGIVSNIIHCLSRRHC